MAASISIIGFFRHDAVRKAVLLLTMIAMVIAMSSSFACAEPTEKSSNTRPHPATNPESSLMLDGNWVPKNTHQIGFDRLPRVASEHAVVSDVRAKNSPQSGLNKESGGVNQHNYLVFHDGKYWVMWSDGPGIEDRVGQRVKFATSPDGIAWGEPEFITPEPPKSGIDSQFYATRSNKGFRWISRGFWLRSGELYALASLDEAAEFFGPSLELHAFRYNSDDRVWKGSGIVYDDAINNFPPKQLPNGEWMMSRRAHDYKNSGVHFLIGGTEAIDRWKSFPVLGSSSELSAEEPLWWVLPDDNLMALFRDNRRGGFLYRSFSIDDGRTWSKPVRTNFPDATSKIHGLRLDDGRYVLVSNANPRKRDPLTIAISNDGMVFNKMGYLVGGRHVDYPHVMQHDKHLLVAFAGGKQTVEVLKIRIADLDRLEMPTSPEQLTKIEK